MQIITLIKLTRNTLERPRLFLAKQNTPPKKNPQIFPVRILESEHAQGIKGQLLRIPPSELVLSETKVAGRQWGQKDTAPGDIQSPEHRNAGSHFQVTLHEPFGQVFGHL